MRINNMLKFSNIGRSAAVAALGLVRGSAQCEGKKEPSEPKSYFSKLRANFERYGEGYARIVLDSSECLSSTMITPMQLPKKFELPNPTTSDLDKSITKILTEDTTVVSTSPTQDLSQAEKKDISVENLGEAPIEKESEADLIAKYKKEIEEINAHHNQKDAEITARTTGTLDPIFQRKEPSVNKTSSEDAVSEDAIQEKGSTEEPSMESTAEKTGEMALNSIANKRRAADGEKEVLNQKEKVIVDKVAEFLAFCEKNPFDDSGKLVKEKELKSLLEDLSISIQKANVSINLPELDSDPVVQGYRDQVSKTRRDMGTWDQIARFARPYSEAYGRFDNLGKSRGDLSKGLEAWKMNKRLASESFETVQVALIAKAKAVSLGIGKQMELELNDVVGAGNKLHDQVVECVLTGSVTDEVAQAISKHARISNKSIEEIVKGFLGGITDNNEAMKKMNEQYSSLKGHLEGVENGLALIKKGNLESVDPSEINPRVNLIGGCKKEVEAVKAELREYEELLLRIKHEEEDKALFTKLDGQMADLNSKVSKLSGSKDMKAYKDALSAQGTLVKTLEVAEKVWSRTPKEGIKSLRHKKMVEAIRENADAKAVLSDEAHKQSLNPPVLNSYLSYAGAALGAMGSLALSIQVVALFTNLRKK